MYAVCERYKDHGIEEARRMKFLVEKANGALHSESYQPVREALTRKL